jgi:hypothetical protein
MTNFINAAIRTVALDATIASEECEATFTSIARKVVSMYGVQVTAFDVRSAVEGDARFDCTTSTVYLLDAPSAE